MKISREKLPCKLGVGYIGDASNAHSAAYWRRYGAHHMPASLKMAGFQTVLCTVEPLDGRPYFRLNYASQKENTYAH